MRIDFLYLSEKDMIEAGVLDAARCIETMRETMSLFGKKDFLLGGPRADEHGLQVNFPAKSDIPVFLSLSITTRMERGSPRALLAILEPYHFIPIRSKGPPR